MNRVRVEKRKTSTLTVHSFLFSSQELESSQLKTNKQKATTTTKGKIYVLLQ